MVVLVDVVLNRTVVDSDWRFVNLWGSHLQSQCELYHVRWWYLILAVDLIGQFSRDVIGRLSVKPSCYWLWSLVMSLVRFDPSIVTVKQSFIVSQITHVRYIKILTWLRGFRVKIAYFSRLHCPQFPRDLSTKKTKPNIEKLPESLGVVIEF